MFISGRQYSRKQIYRMLHPGDSQMPGGGNWLTGYVVVPFNNIDVPGRNSAYDYPNKFNAEKNILTWYGKNKAHSEQPTILGLSIFMPSFAGIQKTLTSHILARVYQHR